MSRLSFHLRVLSLLLVFPTFTTAQEVSLSEAEALKAGDKQAFELLEAITVGISSLRTAENRIYLGAAAADLLWSKDEKRARELFDTVTREMVSVLAAFDPSDEQHYNGLGTIQQQRQETIDRMARHDPVMAMTFLRATRLPLDQAEHRANETRLELHLAGLIASKDPAQALRTARDSLRKGSAHAVVHLLAQIDAKDHSSAQSLHREIVDQLKNEDLAKIPDAANAAWSLVTSYQPPQAREDTYRELLEILSASVLSVTPRDSANISMAQNYYNQLRSIMPQLQKYAPGRVPALRHWLQGVQRTQSPGTRMYQEVHELIRKGTVDDILALAGKYAPEFHTQIYQQAASKAMSSGDPNRARQIISNLVTDPSQRRQMLHQLDNQLLWNTINENKIAEARRMLSRIKSVEQRVNPLLSMAMNVSHRGDKKQALELLAEVRASLDSLPQDSSKLNLQLQLAQNYSSLDPEQSVALMESIIAQVNRFVEAGVVLDGFEHRYLKEGEWMKGGYSTLCGLINNLEHHLGQLARRDPSGARDLSNQLERLEIRLMAQLVIAQSVLGGTHSPPHNTRRFVRLNR